MTAESGPDRPRCQKWRMKHNVPYPRTCEECGLGPCKYPTDNPMQEHMIETTLLDGLEHPSIKRYIEEMKGRGWKIKSRSVVFEREGKATNADDLAVMQKAMAEEVARVEGGGEPDPSFFEKMVRLRAEYPWRDKAL